MTREEFEKRYADARRRAIERDFARLNDMQRKAVLTTEGPLLLLAGAGSGKTTVLINRIANLLRYGCGSDTDFVPEWATEDDLDFLEAYASGGGDDDRERVDRLCAVDPVEPWRLIAITFTNKAADEMKDRLERMLGPEASDIWAMTFHSACVRILRRNIDRLGFDTSFTIYDTSDSQSLMKRIIRELDLDDKTYNNKSVLNVISRAKDAMTSAEAFAQAAEKSGDIRKRNIGRAYLEYSRRMKDANALDFDDLILFTVKLLLEYPDVREYYQRRFRYVLIDEYQDTNNLQYMFASLLAGERKNICVVGDDDQSIYKFRGATIENILSFESNYKGARTIRLEQNYRSTGHILAAANSVIRNNKGRKGKELWTESGMGEKPVLYIASDERDEAQYVAGKILAEVACGGRWSDNAVLYRMNAQSNAIEFAFKRNGIPYKVVGGTRFFERAEIKDMLAYMCAVQNPADDLRLLRIINQPPRGIGEATIETVRQIAATRGAPVFEVLRDAGRIEALGRSAARLGRFVELIEDLRGLADAGPLDEFYDALLEKTGYEAMLREKKTDENLTRLENVSELKSNITAYMKENEEDASLAGFLDEIALYTDIDQYDRGADSVVMMTMHSAKGLEFKSVFIVGAEEGIFPGARSIGEPDEMEEERRLCYVAMTRAKERLFLICARHRMLFGRTTAGKVSRFVDEVDREHINRPPESGYSFSFGGESGAWDTRGGAGGFAGGGYGSGGYGGRGFEDAVSDGYGYERRPAPKKKPVPAPKPASAAKYVPLFATGDRVEHKAFGAGTVTKVQPTGNDALLEVEFDTVGTKRLMMKSAANYMTKL